MSHEYAPRGADRLHRGEGRYTTSEESSSDNETMGNRFLANFRDIKDLYISSESSDSSTVSQSSSNSTLLNQSRSSESSSESSSSSSSSADSSVHSETNSENNCNDLSLLSKEGGRLAQRPIEAPRRFPLNQSQIPSTHNTVAEPSNKRLRNIPAIISKIGRTNNAIPDAVFAPARLIPKIEPEDSALQIGRTNNDIPNVVFAPVRLIPKIEPEDQSVNPFNAVLPTIITKQEEVDSEAEQTQNVSSIGMNDANFTPMPNYVRGIQKRADSKNINVVFPPARLSSNLELNLIRADYDPTGVHDCVANEQLHPAVEVTQPTQREVTLTGGKGRKMCVTVNMDAVAKNFPPSKVVNVVVASGRRDRKLQDELQALQGHQHNVIDGSLGIVDNNGIIKGAFRATRVQAREILSVCLKRGIEEGRNVSVMATKVRAVDSLPQIEGLSGLNENSNGHRQHSRRRRHQRNSPSDRSRSRSRSQTRTVHALEKISSRLRDSMADLNNMRREMANVDRGSFYISERMHQLSESSRHNNELSRNVTGEVHSINASIRIVNKYIESINRNILETADAVRGLNNDSKRNDNHNRIGSVFAGEGRRRRRM